MKKNLFSTALLLGASILTFGQSNTFPPSGNVGIGVTDPKTKLDVNGSITAKNDNSIGFNILDNFEYQNYKIAHYGLTQYKQRVGISGWDGLRFFTEGTLRFTINTNGNIGIGAIVPQTKLDVDGPILLGGSEANFHLGEKIKLDFLKNSGKMTIGYNYSGWKGETSFISNRGSAAQGGFSFYDYGNDNKVNNLVRIEGNGNVGIGITDPNTKLEVNGPILLGGSEANFHLGEKIKLDFLKNSGKMTIGYNYSGWKGETSFISNRGSAAQGGFSFYDYGNDNKVNNLVRIEGNGNVGIGTNNPDQKLTVKGKIHAEEVIVDLNVPADYVFQKYYTGKSDLKTDYVFPKLNEIETFVKENNHLPDMPSAKEIQENGLKIGEMNNLLLQKIEELTLLLIEQNKINQEQQEQLINLKEEINQLKQK